MYLLCQLNVLLLLLHILKQHIFLDPPDDFIQSDTPVQIRKHVRLIAPLFLRVPVHDLQTRMNILRNVDFVDHQQIRLRDAGAAFARDLFPFAHIDDEDQSVDEFGAEGWRERKNYR